MTDLELDQKIRESFRRWRQANPEASLTSGQLLSLVAGPGEHPNHDGRLRARVTAFWDLLVEFGVVRRSR